MNRVFICGYLNFPRGGAASNYVQNLAKVFLAMGKEVIVITNQNTEYLLADKKYQGIVIEPISLKTNKVGHYLDFHFRLGKYFTRILENYKIDYKDIIIAYSRDSSTLNAILKMGRKFQAKTAVCLVEWFEKKDFNHGMRNLLFWNSQNAFYRLNQKFDLLFPISTYIEAYYKKKGCRTFRIPCLVDTSEFEYKKKTLEGKKIFVFPGNGKMKDALFEMLQAFSMLSEKEIDKIEFHICGIHEYANEIIRNTLLEKYLGISVIIHDWMKYETLVELYQRAHFLLLARDISRMTKANFPSKIPETLSYGIIPVCSNVGDYTELYLKDGINSIQMNGASASEICQAIRRGLSISNSEFEKMSRCCRETAVKQFDYRNWIERLESQL